MKDLAEALSESSQADALRFKAQLEGRSTADALKRDAALSEAKKPLKNIAWAEGAVEKQLLAPDARVLKQKLSSQESGLSAIAPQPPTRLAPAGDAEADRAMQPSGRSNRQSRAELAELPASLGAHGSPLVRIGRVLFAKWDEAPWVIVAGLLGAALGTAIALVLS